MLFLILIALVCFTIPMIVSVTWTPFLKWSRLIPITAMVLGGSAVIASVSYQGTGIFLPVALVPLAQVLIIRIYYGMFSALMERPPEPIRDRIFGNRPMPAADSVGATLLHLVLLFGPIVAIVFTFSSTNWRRH